MLLCTGSRKPQNDICDNNKSILSHKWKSRSCHGWPHQRVLVPFSLGFSNFAHLWWAAMELMCFWGLISKHNEDKVWMRQDFPSYPRKASSWRISWNNLFWTIPWKGNGITLWPTWPLVGQSRLGTLGLRGKVVDASTNLDSLKRRKWVGAVMDRQETLHLRNIGDFVFLILKEASVQVWASIMKQEKEGWNI